VPSFEQFNPDNSHIFHSLIHNHNREEEDHLRLHLCLLTFSAPTSCHLAPSSYTHEIKQTNASISNTTAEQIKHQIMKEEEARFHQSGHGHQQGRNAPYGPAVRAFFF
jgi:hypothetical protein